MSEPQFVKCAGRGFWAYDLAVGVFFRYLLDAANESGEANSLWLSDAVSSWRVWAVVRDYGFTLDEQWSPEQRKTFIALAERACNELTSRKSISAEEIVGWSFADDLHIHPRGATEVFTAPVVELGCAMIALLRHELPEAPQARLGSSAHLLAAALPKWNLGGTDGGKLSTAIENPD